MPERRVCPGVDTAKLDAARCFNPCFIRGRHLWGHMVLVLGTSSLTVPGKAATSVAARTVGPLIVAWTGQREYGLAQIQEPQDVLKAVFGLVLITTLSAPGVFGVWQALRPTLVAQSLVEDTEVAMEREANVLLATCVAFGAWVVSECLDCGH